MKAVSKSAKANATLKQFHIYVSLSIYIHTIHCTVYRIHGWHSGAVGNIVASQQEENHYVQSCMFFLWAGFLWVL